MSEKELAEKELTSLKRKLAAAKTWCTRVVNTLKTLLGDSIIDRTAVEEGLRSANEKLSAFDDVQGQLEMAVPEEEMEQCITSAADFKDEKMKIILQAMQALQEKTTEELSEPSTSSSSRSSLANVSLPKIDLGKYSGEVTEWIPFQEKFDALIGSKDLPTVTKFTYLLSSLEGEAKGVIQGLSVVEQNYAVARKLLDERFGRKEQIRFAHIQALLNLPQMPSGQRNVSALWSWKDTLLSHIRSLEGLDVKGSQCGMFLTPIILSRLPHHMRMEWSREGEGKEADLEFLLDTLTKEIRRLERSDAFRDTNQTSSEKRNNKKQPVASALPVSSSSSSAKPVCVFCDKTHPSHKCRKLRSYHDRKNRLKGLRLCYRCLGPHYSPTCSKVCGECAGDHHISLCYAHTGRPEATSPGERTRAKSSVQTSSSSQMPPSSPQMLHSPPLQTSTESVPHQDPSTNFQGHVQVESASQVQTALPVVRVKVVSGREKVYANVLLDSGSDRSYVTSTLVKKVNPLFVRSDHVNYAAFGESQKEMGLRNVYALNVQGTKQGQSEIHAVEVPMICTPMNRPSIPTSKLTEFSHLPLVDTGNVAGQTFTIDILVGLDSYWKIVRGGVVFGSDGLVAQQTVFGWMDAFLAPFLWGDPSKRKLPMMR